MTTEAAWIADGTASAEPVTTETPDTTTTTEQPVAVVDAGSADRPHDESGRFVAASGATETPATPAAPAETPQTQAEAVRAFIEGKLGDQPFQLPEDVLLPLKRGKDVDYRPLKEVLTDGLRLNDYSRKMNELRDREAAAEAREQERARMERKLQEREKYLAERDEQIKAALTDPASAAKYEQHLQMLRDNPMYRKAWERDWTARETEVDLAILREDQDRRIVQEASTRAKGWIETLATEFPGVDPGRVASIYGQRLSAGQASLDVNEVRQIYRSEADYIAGATKPLQDQLADLAAKIDAMSASKAAETHNATTKHAVQRAKTVPVATGSGAPAKTSPPRTKFSPNELTERNQAWIKEAV